MTVGTTKAIKDGGLLVAHLVISWWGIPAAAAFGTLSEITPRWDTGY
jgi:hypothetical protein